MSCQLLRQQLLPNVTPIRASEILSRRFFHHSGASLSLRRAAFAVKEKKTVKENKKRREVITGFQSGNLKTHDGDGDGVTQFKDAGCTVATVTKQQNKMQRKRDILDVTHVAKTTERDGNNDCATGELTGPVSSLEQRRAWKMWLLLHGESLPSVSGVEVGHVSPVKKRRRHRASSKTSSINDSNSPAASPATFSARAKSSSKSTTSSRTTLVPQPPHELAAVMGQFHFHRALRVAFDAMPSAYIRTLAALYRLEHLGGKHRRGDRKGGQENESSSAPATSVSLIEWIQFAAAQEQNGLSQVSDIAKFYEYNHRLRHKSTTGSSISVADSSSQLQPVLPRALLDIYKDYESEVATLQSERAAEAGEVSTALKKKKEKQEDRTQEHSKRKRGTQKKKQQDKEENTQVVELLSPDMTHDDDRFRNTRLLRMLMMNECHPTNV